MSGEHVSIVASNQTRNTSERCLDCLWAFRRFRVPETRKDWHFSRRIFVRYPDKQVTDRCAVLCSSGWIPPELDESLVKLQIDLMKEILECPNVPLEIKAWLRMVLHRGAADLVGIQKNAAL